MPGGQVTTSQSRATLRCPSRVNGHPEDDAVLIEFPMLRRVPIGRFQDRLVEEPDGEW